MKKILSSKNLSAIVETLLEQNKENLVMQLFENPKFKTFSGQVRNILTRKNNNFLDFSKTKIFSGSELSQNTLQQISASTNLKLEGAQVIIDKSITAGAIIKSGERKIDATLSTMLQKGLQIQN